MGQWAVPNPAFPAWRPLAGRRIVITRAAEQAEALRTELEAEGAEAIALPTIAFAPPLDPANLDAALAEAAGADGWVFTSANAVRAVFARAAVLGARLTPPRHWVCAVGPATAAALRQHEGWEPTLVPAIANAEGVTAALEQQELRDRRIVFPHADAARDLIPRALAARGARVVSVECYRTVLEENSRTAARALFPGADAVIFTSPSTARHLAVLLGEDHQERMRMVRVAVIGPVTRLGVEELGWTVGVEAERPEGAALVAALRTLWHA